MKSLYIFVFLLIFNSVCGSTSNKSCSWENENYRLMKRISYGQKFNENLIYHDGLVYDSDHYFEEITENRKVIRGCPCQITTCYRKCCLKGKLLTTKCVYSEKAAKYYEEIKIYDFKTPTNLTIEENFAEIYDIRCPTGQVRILNPLNGDEVYLQKNGSLVYTVAGYDYWVNPEEFCMEKYDREDFKELTALVCWRNDTEDNVAVTQRYSAFLIVVLPFYLTIFLVYTIIPELRTFHGICLANYSICLFIAWLCLSIVYLRKISGTFCIFLALSIYSTFMASFFWLNGMCIDAWLTFRGGCWYFGLSKRKKIIYYSIYAWGAAAICLFVVMFLQFVGPKCFPHLILPKIGVDSCWFPDNRTRGFYLYGIVLFLMIINIILFLLTANNIWKARKQTKKSLKSDSRRHYACDQQRFIFYIKLFIAFGVNWSFELIPWLLGGTPPFQEVLDIINILYGIIIFIIAICSKNILRVLKSRCHKELSWISKYVNATRSTQATSTASSTQNAMDPGSHF